MFTFKLGVFINFKKWDKFYKITLLTVNLFQSKMGGGGLKILLKIRMRLFKNIFSKVYIYLENRKLFNFLR